MKLTQSHHINYCRWRESLANVRSRLPRLRGIKEEVDRQRRRVDRTHDRAYQHHHKEVRGL